MVKLDDKNRLTLPKRLAAELKIRPGQPVLLKPQQGTLVIERLSPRSKAGKRADTLSWLLANPLHVSKQKLKRLDIDRIEDEMWYP